MAAPGPMSTTLAVMGSTLPVTPLRRSGTSSALPPDAQMWLFGTVGLVPDVEMSASPVSVSPATRPYSAAWPTMSKASGAFGSAGDIRASPELCEKVCGLVVAANPPYCPAALPVIEVHASRGREWLARISATS